MQTYLGTLSGQPIRLNDQKDVRVKFRHNLRPWPAEISARFNHSRVYDPSENWNGGEVARRPV